MGYTVHGILQSRILEWVAFPFSRGSSQHRDWICIAGRFFTSWVTKGADKHPPWTGETPQHRIVWQKMSTVKFEKLCHCGDCVTSNCRKCHPPKSPAAGLRTPSWFLYPVSPSHGLPWANDHTRQDTEGSLKVTFSFRTPQHPCQTLLRQHSSLRHFISLSAFLLSRPSQTSISEEDPPSVFPPNFLPRLFPK